MNRFKLVFSEAVRSIGANLSTSFAATMTVLIGMFLLGLFIALGTWVVSWSDHVKSELQVKVYFVEGVTPKQVNNVADYFAPTRESASITSFPRARRCDGRGRRTPSSPQNLPSNPLPASFEITPVRAEVLKAISADLRSQKFAGVEVVKDGQQTSKRILQRRTRDRAVFLSR